MNQFFTADFILPVTGPPIKNGVIETNNKGTIIGIHTDQATLKDKKITTHKGMIVPGFINAHCHLELSHMKGIIPRKIGLISFISEVMSKRHASQEEIKSAMLAADREMFKNGIVAVGDHVNSLLSTGIKEKSPIYYHSFVELIGFDGKRAQSIVDNGAASVKEFQNQGLQATMTPHSSYSASKELFRLFCKMFKRTEQPISIHNQESEEENQFFRYKKGPFLDFYEKWKINISHWTSSSKTSLITMGPWLPKSNRIQLVHNTYTKPKELNFMSRIGINAYWCLCPNANIYIENRLPGIVHLISNDSKITVGTDSLASNEQLCILSELKQLHDAVPELEITESLRWATQNGAEFLGIERSYGSIEVGKTPGLNLLENVENFVITANTTVKRLI